LSGEGPGVQLAQSSPRSRLGTSRAREVRGEPNVARCPICQSVRIVIVVSPQRRAFCTACGARWIQEGSEQRAVKRPALSTGAVPSTVRQA